METVVLAIQRVARGKELLARFLKEGTVSKPLWRVQWVHFTLNKWSRPWGRRRGAPKSPFCIPKSSALLIQPMESISLPPPSPQKLKDAWRLNFSRFCSELSCHCTQARWAVKSPGMRPLHRPTTWQLQHLTWPFESLPPEAHPTSKLHPSEMGPWDGRDSHVHLKHHVC